MTLIAIGVAVLGGEVGDLRIAEREGIPLVVVVRLVLRVRVVGLELNVLRGTLRQTERDSVVLAARGRLDRREGTDAVAATRAESATPHTACNRTFRI